MEEPVWKCSWLTKELHGLPHLNLSFVPVSDIFDMKSFEYKSSLIILSFLPAIFALAVLLPYLAFKLIFEGNPSLIDCPCKESAKNWMRYLTIACVLVMFIPIICEFIIHNKAVEFVKPPTLEAGLALNLAAQAAPYRADANTTRLNETMPYEPTAIEQPLLWPVKLEIGSFMTEFQKYFAGLKLLSIPPTELYSPGNIKFLAFEKAHFVGMLVLWLIGIAIVLALPHRYWQTALAGLIYCCILAGIMLAVSVAFADICIYPGIFFDESYLQIPRRKKLLRLEIIKMCLDVIAKLDDERPKFKLLLQVYRDRFFKMFKELEADLQKKNEDLNNDIRYTVLKSLEENYFKNNLEGDKPKYNWIDAQPKPDCAALSKFKDEIIPIENYESVCRLIEWMGVQFLATILGAGVFIGILMRHTADLKTLVYYKTAWEENQKESLMAKPPPCDKPICQASNVCVCNEEKLRKLSKAEREEVEIREAAAAAEASAEAEKKRKGREEDTVAFAHSSSSRWPASRSIMTPSFHSTRTKK